MILLTKSEADKLNGAPPRTPVRRSRGPLRPAPLLAGAPCAPKPLMRLGAPKRGQSSRFEPHKRLTLGDLFERMRTSMPQNDPGGLSRQQNADILAYVLSSNKFPAGTTELGRDTEALKQIRFQSLKPQ